jgi:type I restriction enzyme M protein
MAQPPARTTDIYDVADHLWGTADELRANSHLKAAEYAIPVLGLIFLKFADSRFTRREAELVGQATGRRQIGKANYQSRGVLFLPEEARFSRLLKLKEGDNLGKAINEAMGLIEDENPALRGVLPRTYRALTNATLVSLLRSVNSILSIRSRLWNPGPDPQTFYDAKNRNDVMWKSRFFVSSLHLSTARILLMSYLRAGH